MDTLLQEDGGSGSVVWPPELCTSESAAVEAAAAAAGAMLYPTFIHTHTPAHSHAHTRAHPGNYVIGPPPEPLYPPSGTRPASSLTSGCLHPAPCLVAVKSSQLPKGAQLNLHLSIRCVSVDKSLLSLSLAFLPYSPLQAKADFSSTYRTFLLISLAGGALIFQNSLEYLVGPTEASLPALPKRGLAFSQLSFVPHRSVTVCI